MSYPLLAFPRHIYPEEYLSIISGQTTPIYLKIKIREYAEFNIALVIPPDRQIFFDHNNEFTQILKISVTIDDLQAFNIIPGISKIIPLNCVIITKESECYDFVLHANSEINDYFSPKIAKILVKFSPTQHPPIA